MKTIKLTIFLFSLLGCITVYLPGKAATTEETHIRRGFTTIGDNEVQTYKFNNTSNDAGYLSMFPKEGMEEEIPANALKNWDIEYQIFTSTDDAELAMVERLDMSNLYMSNIIDLPLEKGAIGDNCWHQISVGTVKFLRNNSYVSISPETGYTNYDSVVWVAQKIDSLIVKSEKVDDTNLIPAPEIQTVEIVSLLPKDWNDTVTVKVTATDQEYQQLSSRKYASGLATSTVDGILKMSLNKLVDSCEVFSKAKVMIWVWNEDNITSSIQVDIPFLATSLNLMNDSSEESKLIKMGQNYPNPFSQTTSIKCYVPEGSQSASIYIFDMLGAKKEQFLITGYCNQTVNVDGYGLYPGMYLYSLLIDNKVIDTKRMILTE